MINTEKGYELNFAGKQLSKRTADKPTDYKLELVPQQSKNCDATDNLIIRGDNLDVLKILKQNYSEKIKLIYIDPPYNTASENFVYDDNFKQNEAQLIENLGLDEDNINYLNNLYSTQNHSGWLSFMYPRLKLARSLLTDDGVIFISIDDNEQANLKLICDEIFGECNFVACFTWQTKRAARGVPPVNMVMSNHEYIICYTKSNTVFNGITRDESDFGNPDNDPRGLWRSESIRSTASQNNIFEIVDPNTGNSYKGGWAFSKNKIDEMIKDDLILFPEKKDGTPRQKKFINSYTNDKKAIVSSLGWYSTENSTKFLMNIFQNKKIFDFPKPVDLIKFLVNQTTKASDTVLDFFAGSGTTADAVMQLNAQDGGNRKFILVQWDEVINHKNNEAIEFCKKNDFKPVISSITIERVNRAGNKILKDNKNKDLFNKTDIGYKVFKLKL